MNSDPPVIAAGGADIAPDRTWRENVRKPARLEVELAEKLRLQRLLADISTHFAGLPSAQVDEGIEQTQRLIVETLGLDRSTLWQIDPQNGDELVLTHCWQRPAWPPLPQGISTAGRLPWSCAQVMKGEMIRFDRVQDLPPEAAIDAEAFQELGPKSNVTFPLMTHGRTFGALAFATLGEEREWRDDEIAELKLVAQIIGNVVSRERAELREEQLREELAHAMRMAALGEMAATLAHELNQPLTAILCNAQAARRFLASGRATPEELGAILDDIVRDDKRAGSVIHNLRTMVSKGPKQVERCCLNELASEVSVLLRSVFIEEKIDVRLTLAPGLPAVEAVRVELQQVLVNFLLNAVQAMRDTPSGHRIIEIETARVKEGVVVSVLDRGRGIAPECLTKIFEPFVSSKASGLGMGLSICRRIVENHGGRIVAASRLEGGAIFTATLPASGTPA